MRRTLATLARACVTAPESELSRAVGALTGAMRMQKRAHRSTQTRNRLLAARGMPLQAVPAPSVEEGTAVREAVRHLLVSQPVDDGGTFPGRHVQRAFAVVELSELPSLAGSGIVELFDPLIAGRSAHPRDVAAREALFRAMLQLEPPSGERRDWLVGHLLAHAGQSEAAIGLLKQVAPDDPRIDRLHAEAMDARIEAALAVLKAPFDGSRAAHGSYGRALRMLSEETVRLQADQLDPLLASLGPLLNVVDVDEWAFMCLATVAGDHPQAIQLAVEGACRTEWPRAFMAFWMGKLGVQLPRDEAAVALLEAKVGSSGAHREVLGSLVASWRAGG